MYIANIDWGEQAIFTAWWFWWGGKGWCDLSGCNSMSHYSTAQSLTPLPVAMLLWAGTKSEMNAASTNSYSVTARPVSAARSFQLKQKTCSVQLIVEPRPTGIKQILSCLTGILVLFFFSDCKTYKKKPCWYSSFLHQRKLLLPVKQAQFPSLTGSRRFCRTAQVTADLTGSMHSLQTPSETHRACGFWGFWRDLTAPTPLSAVCVYGLVQSDIVD